MTAALFTVAAAAGLFILAGLVIDDFLIARRERLERASTEA